MRSFENDKLRKFRIPNGLASALADCERRHGEEVLLGKAEPAVVQTLKHQSIITSSEASCAIEGIHIAPERKEAVFEIREEPRDRPEREVQNYCRALEFIYTAEPEELLITPEFIRHIHSLIKEGEADAGEWKVRDNVIEEEVGGRKRIRFYPVSHKLVEDATEQLCLHYTGLVQKQEVPALVAISALTLDLTAIHPFRDGNGRMSRLVTTAALVEQGYELPKYISLEELIQDRSDDYYRALERSSVGWHTGNHDLEPFLRFQIQTLTLGYKELAMRRERVMEPVNAILSPLLANDIEQEVKRGFSEIYPNAVFAKEELRQGKLSGIKGFRTDLPKEEWEKGRRAQRLLESLIIRAKKKGSAAQSAQSSEVRLVAEPPQTPANKGSETKLGGK